MNPETIFELIQSELMPRFRDELRAQLRDIRNEIEYLSDTIIGLGDAIDRIVRSETEDDNVADES